MASVLLQETGGKFVAADQKIAGRNKAPLHLHSNDIYKLAVIRLKNDHEFFVFG